ncbi:hypothetical protein F0M18_13605 [Pseudohalioglobus sediminis]|uniref:Lipoprotein n=1 Tax=Pseudohalioglobus sediminis TaxID=2606449 RepID=A0A5B0WT89_9GAMM|nr:hypothetical protein [Pseudohalioglobus sediminis]KAA1190096.1 hypothetical protein F0M18_13605 [Pseudohalioglobus sediminis]
MSNETMKKAIAASAAKVIGMAGAIILSTACASNPSSYLAFESCALDSTSNLNAAIAQVESKLKLDQCAGNFELYSSELIAIARKNTAEGNLDLFASYVRRSIDKGHVTGNRGKELFSRYFDDEFYSLKSLPGSLCYNLSSEERKADLKRDLQAELSQKRVGKLEVLGDKEGFRASQAYFEQTMDVLNALDSACSAENRRMAAR